MCVALVHIPLKGVTWWLCIMRNGQKIIKSKYLIIILFNNGWITQIYLYGIVLYAPSN